uniref:Ig-like domain-containing protein n=1 Tax=Cyprinus carpio TaxID=7962 RepID=A0A8C2HIE1_CYPCA
MTLSLTGHSGGEINITCTYQDRHTGNAKYFCKVLWLKCSDLIKTKEKDKWVNSGRFFLYDDTGAAVFTVIFRNLSEQDSGKYKCGVDKLGIDSYTEVNLNVITAPKTVSVSSPSPSTTTSSSSSSSSSSITTPPISLNSQPSTSDFTLDSPSVSNGILVIRSFIFSHSPAVIRENQSLVVFSLRFVSDHRCVCGSSSAHRWTRFMYSDCLHEASGSS